jgi:hypothetical protein
MNLESGDQFENHCADWIRANLPSYENIWSAFIGHNGRGWPMAISGLNADQERRRKKFYQAHYSFAFACFQLGRFVDSIDDNLGKSKGFDGFAKDQVTLTSVMAYVGQVRDMFKQIDEALGMHGAILNPMQEFYVLRSHVLHGPRLPYQLEDGCVKIPKIAGGNAKVGEWDDKALWEDTDPKQYVFIADFCRITFTELMALVNKLHPAIFDAANKLLDGRRVDSEPTGEALAAGVLYSTLTPAFSAYIPPSGDRGGYR